MHIRLIAVGGRQPAWVDEAFDAYVGRLPPQWKFRLDRVVAGRRGGNADTAGAVESEGRKVLERVGPDYELVLLDEAGTEISSRELVRRLSSWQHAGKDLCFVIGGPDGASQALKDRADFCWSLSKLTLPHGLTRVLLAEQLYRAWSLSAGHPYHRS